MRNCFCRSVKSSGNFFIKALTATLRYGFLLISGLLVLAAVAYVPLSFYLTGSEEAVASAVFLMWGVVLVVVGVWVLASIIIVAFGGRKKRL